jgi:hypothetical protein
MCDVVCDVTPSKGKGEEMLEKMRAAGRPITPQMEKMAKWMDQVGVCDLPAAAPALLPWLLRSIALLHCTPHHRLSIAAPARRASDVFTRDGWWSRVILSKHKQMHEDSLVPDI